MIYPQSSYPAWMFYRESEMTPELKLAMWGDLYAMGGMTLENFLERAEQVVIAATASYGKRWKVNQCWWEGQEIGVTQREIIKESA